MMVAAACKPKSTDLTTAGSSSLQTTSSSKALQSTTADLTTAIALTIETTAEASTVETTSEAAATTSSASCAGYTQVIPPPSGKVCAKEVIRRSFVDSSPLYLKSQVPTSGLTGCAKCCADTPRCVSFYVEFNSVAPGAPVFKICFMFKGYEKDIPFGEGRIGGLRYYEQGCFACVGDEAPQPPIPS